MGKYILYVSMFGERAKNIFTKIVGLFVNSTQSQQLTAKKFSFY